MAERKVRALLSGRARVKLISPVVTRGIARLAEQGRLEIVAREYRQGDLEGAVLAFAAAGRNGVNRQVRDDALRLAIPLNVADNPDLCDFIVPSLVARGPLLIAISTSGLLPMLSKRLRKEIMGALAADYAAYARRVGTFRRFLIKHVESPRRRKEIMERVGRAAFAEVARMTLREMKARFLAPSENTPPEPRKVSGR